MRTSSRINPLIANFIIPQTPKVVNAEESALIYDPQSQITLFMGGGSKSPSRCQDGYKATNSAGHAGEGAYGRNDAERYTDD